MKVKKCRDCKHSFLLILKSSIGGEFTQKSEPVLVCGFKTPKHRLVNDKGRVRTLIKVVRCIKERGELTFWERITCVSNKCGIDGQNYQ